MPIIFGLLGTLPPIEAEVSGYRPLRGEAMADFGGSVVVGGLEIRGAVVGETDFGEASPPVPTHVSGAVFARGGIDMSTVAAVSIEGGPVPRVYIAPGYAIEGGVAIGGRVGHIEAADDTIIYLNEEQPIIACYVGMSYAQAVDLLAFDALSRRIYTTVSRTPLVLGGVARPEAYEGTKKTRENLVLGEDPAAVVHLLATSGITFTSLATGDYRLVARAVSLLILAGRATNYAEAMQQVADALAFADLAEWLRQGGVADALVLSSRLDAFYAAFANVVERLVLMAQAAPEFTLTVALRDGFAFDAAASHEAQLAAQLADAIGFAMSLSFDNGEFIAWVMNTESRGLTQYTNYPFNSFAKIGGRHYGAHPGGLALLGGDDDMGAPIKAKLRLGMFDFGSRHLKSFSDAFVGMSTNGQMLLKAVFVDDRTGEKSMAIYKVLARPAAGGVRETRAKLGKGIQAVDWDFQLENVDGADFDLQSIQFYPTQLSRRTRG